jgi:hypothetical protein
MPPTARATDDFVFKLWKLAHPPRSTANVIDNGNLPQFTFGQRRINVPRFTVFRFGSPVPHGDTRDDSAFPDPRRRDECPACWYVIIDYDWYW